VAEIKRRALEPAPIADDPREPDHVKMARPVKKEAASPFHPSAKRQIAAASAELLHQTRIKNLKKGTSRMSAVNRSHWERF